MLLPYVSPTPFFLLEYSLHLSRIGGIRELLKCLKWLEALSAQFPFLTYSVAESVDYSVVLLLPVLVRVTSKRETLTHKILIFLDRAFPLVLQVPLYDPHQDSSDCLSPELS